MYWLFGKTTLRVRHRNCYEESSEKGNYIVITPSQTNKRKYWIAMQKWLSL